MTTCKRAPPLPFSLPLFSGSARRPPAGSGVGQFPSCGPPRLCLFSAISVSLSLSFNTRWDPSLPLPPTR